MYTLEKLNINKIARIEDINCESNIKRRMMDLGIVKGTKIKAKTGHILLKAYQNTIVMET